MKKQRKLTPEKRAAIARRLALHPPEPTRVGSDLVLAAGGKVYLPGEPEHAAKEAELVGYFDYGSGDEDLQIAEGETFVFDFGEALRRL